MKNIVETADRLKQMGDSAGAVCPVCDRSVQDELFSLAALPANLQTIIRPNARTNDAVEACERCVELFTRAHKQIESHALALAAEIGLTQVREWRF